MGITGLIPFLEKSSRQTNISEFSGKTVAVDTYCWLHKGAFSCADKLAMGQETNLYVKYCMKLVQMLLSNKIKPILVFDGRHLPAKAETEVKRREAREMNRKRAAECIKMGKIAEGKNLLRRSLDVSHKMALEVIKECQAHNIDCIVAPYEADAQLAYLNLSGIADIVITEDSDLTLFGCKKIFFKMDLTGNGLLVEQDRLHLSMGLRCDDFSMDKFIHMCVLSGCDYLASLPGIGLQKACKFIVKTTDKNIYNALTRMASTLNKKTLVVTKEYRDNFMRALVTFKHQLVFCPLQRKQVRLNPPTSDVTDEQLIHAGTEINAELAWQLALGNCDPFSYKKLHDFDPDRDLPNKSNAWSEVPVAKHVSIWSTDYKTKSDQTERLHVSPKNGKNQLTTAISTRGKIVTMKTDSIKKEITPKKRSYEESDLSMDELMQLYKRPDVEKHEDEPPIQPVSPILTRRSNPFRKLNDSNETSPSLVHRPRKRIVVKSRFKPTVINYANVQKSKFFSDEPKVDDNEDKKTNDKQEDGVTESMEVNVDSQDYKENMDSIVDADEPKINVIITKTEFFDHDEAINNSNLQDSISKDSGDKEPSDCKDNRQVMVTEKEPLHSLNDNMVISTTEFPDELKSKKNKEIGQEQFSITREIFSEFKSSMFASEKTDTRQTRKSLQISQNSPTLSLKKSSSKRVVKTITKKSNGIQGQQSLLNMFGFNKKNSFQH